MSAIESSTKDVTMTEAITKEDTAVPAAVPPPPQDPPLKRQKIEEVNETAPPVPDVPEATTVIRVSQSSSPVALDEKMTVENRKEEEIKEVKTSEPEPTPEPSSKIVDETPPPAEEKPVEPKLYSQPSTGGNSVTSAASQPTKNTRATINEEVVTKYVKMPDIPRRVPALPKLTADELLELELALQFDSEDEENGWRDDWAGNLAFINKDISNPITKRRKPHKQETIQALWEWAQAPSSSQSLRLGRNLLAYVYHMAPSTAQKILGHASMSWQQDPKNYDIFEAVKRCSYDPAVLREDGWTTSTSAVFGGSASGGPKHIGKEVVWQGFEAAIIAYVHDNDFGDLWKGMWLDAYETFDLEAEELQEAIKKWERKNKRAKTKKQQNEATSARFAAIKDFAVEGIEHGIVMATTYNPNARQSVFWPARVLHVSELDKSQSQTKRNSAKQKVTVVFLAPYWNTTGAPGRAANYSSYPLFQMESIDVSHDTIERYRHDGHQGINIHQLRVGFRFTGLPKNAFGRYLDSHRMAMALKLYAQDELVATSTKSQQASAALFDTHPLAINTARFPSSILNLPFLHILSKLKSPGKKAAADEEDAQEPTVQLAYIMKSMEPPRCFGSEPGGTEQENGARANKGALTLLASPQGLLASANSSNLAGASGDNITIGFLLSEYLQKELTSFAASDMPSSSLLQNLEKLVARANRIIGQFSGEAKLEETAKNLKLKSLLQECLRMKSYGEDTLAADFGTMEAYCNTVLAEWRKSCERLFKCVTLRCSRLGFGDGVTVVLSDSRCNQHITKSGCVERPVRLPAAIKATKQAGAGKSPSFPLKLGIEDKYMSLATDKFLEKAHTVSYLKKIKARCTAIAPDANGAHLTEGSDGEGGCDTTGSNGTWDAAVAGVAAAMKAVDLIVGGHCVNAFCVTRPPGHHAGRDLHPMGAISNGFCILNPVACAAIYATTPPSEGGLGLKRAAVIDFDVHHGNGTQDILCSTYDPRFLYVSMHAGGAHINGYQSDDSDMDFPKVGSKKQEGIYPGRCGDTSPHKGVINLPLGARVTPHDVGNALVTVVEPAIEAFSPDIIILSAGFDGHKNDPLGMGGLSAHDFGHITEVACGMAFRFCSGRIMSVLEGGYGVPCCRPQKDVFLPPAPVSEEAKTEAPIEIVSQAMADATQPAAATDVSTATNGESTTTRPPRIQPSKLLDLGASLPEEMDDQVTPGMQRKLEKCHAEGFVDCVQAHVTSLKENNSRA